jgi:tetratricopeptide (TPR) repeat protein
MHFCPQFGQCARILLPLYQTSCFIYNKAMKRSITILALVLLFSACASNTRISEDLTPAEIIQRAQEASDRHRYRAAMQFYQALLERNRNNIDLVITAEYEIAFIQYKQRNFEAAREGLNGVLAYYDSPDAELLPQHFKRLAEIVLNRMDEIESRRRRPSQR